ncbi:flagellin [Halomonas sp. SL1]|uniref:flagellin N-terminal helical domain-containing protein n=1 Tax=Halomonas sp. SL1 TaxID=2137478 RepID=UPI000D17AAC6|nr:flagellin [Halomonas sp. SL1]RAH36583.1 flagellin FliC [Halomonas sp. SL1]
MSVINTNITSLIGQNNLRSSQDMLAKAQERLSSGMRINSAADDAAGQAIANRMTAQITGMNQASRNASDGISLVQTMEGGLDQISDNLQRIRELSVQAANDTNSDEDRASIQLEIKERSDEITRIAKSTSFNDTKLLDTAQTLNMQIGANTNAGVDDISVDTTNMQATAIGSTGTKIDDIDVAGTFGDAQTAIDAVDSALQQVDDARATLGATLNRFDSVVQNLETNSTNLTEARSRIEDADYAQEVSNMTKANILQQAGTSMLAQANQTPQSVLSLLG